MLMKMQNVDDDVDDADGADNDNAGDGDDHDDDDSDNGDDDDHHHDDDDDEEDGDDDDDKDDSVAEDELDDLDVAVETSNEPLYTEIYRTNAAPQIGPRTRAQTLCEPRSRNACQNFVRATRCRNLEAKCRRPE